MEFCGAGSLQDVYQGEGVCVYGCVWLTFEEPTIIVILTAC